MLKKTLLVLSFILILFVGCNTSKNISTTQTVAPVNNFDLTPTVVSSQVPSSLNDEVFTDKSIIPQSKDVFDGINFRLLLRSNEHTMGIYDLSSGGFDTEVPVSDAIIGFPVVSKDGVLLAQIHHVEDKKYLQIQNLTRTGNQEISTLLPDDAILITWLSNTRLAVWGSSDERKCIYFLLQYDSLSAEIIYPAHPTPTLQAVQCMQLPLLTADGTRMLYPWQMFDFQTGNLTDTFSFMKNVPSIPPAYSFKELDGRISIAHTDKDKLSYVLDIPFDEINDESLEPKEILLPGIATKDGWWQPLVWWPQEMKIGMDLADEQINPLDVLISGQQVPTRFHVVDFVAHQIIDYNFDRGVFLDDSAPQRTYQSYLSPDDKYFAWTIYDNSSGLPIGSRVLELSSGNIISIPGCEVVGWTVNGTK